MHWTPDPIGESIEILDKHTVDSKDSNRETAYDITEQLKGAASAGVNETLVAHYVTSFPDETLDLIKEGADLKTLHVNAGGGLLVSSHPGLWKRLNKDRWSFMALLSIKNKGVLIDKLRGELGRQSSLGYITKSEYEFGLRLLRDWEGSEFWDPVVMLSEQPYNIEIDKIAEEEGIPGIVKPLNLPVTFVGRYVSTYHDDAADAAAVLAMKTLNIPDEKALTEADVRQALKIHGWDGVFIPSYRAKPRLMIWDANNILSFGDWKRDGAAMSGSKRDRMWIPGDRYEAYISSNRKVVDVRDTRLNEQFMLLREGDLLDLLGVVQALGHGQVIAGDRFSAVLEDVAPDIVDGRSGVRLRGLQPADVVELSALLGTVLESLL